MAHAVNAPTTPTKERTMLYTSDTLTADEIAKLKAQNGPELTAVYARKGVIVFRKPTRVEYDLWSDKARINAADSAACRQLAQSCVVSPCTYDDLMLVIDDQPALLQNEISSAITAMAGLADKFEVKKL